MSRVIVGLSGGVDSAISAYLLKQQGHDVRCMFMKNWEEDDTNAYCHSAEDLQDAESVCSTLDLELEVVNFALEYWEHVFEIFLQQHRAGLTANPDVLCNREIKFTSFLQHAQALGAEKIAMGHYAGIRETSAQWQLLKGRDPTKDQSYFLYMLGQQQLRHALFPLADLTKAEVRRLAKLLGLSNASKKDSTGICFIGERKFRHFLEQYIPSQAGAIITLDGQAIGQHQGLAYYTIGQRSDLNIGGLKGFQAEPWYVADKDIQENTLVVVQGSQHPALFHQSLTANQLHWVAGQPPSDHFQATAKTRYRQNDEPCTVDVLDHQIHVHFKQPQRAITPGQAVVLYQGPVCLGGGTICARSH